MTIDVGKHKYSAKATVVDGIRFASKLEAQCYASLKILQGSGAIQHIERQPSFILQEGFKKNGETFRPIRYVADFRVLWADGRLEIIDCKGMSTPVYRLKRALFERRYPESSISEWKRGNVRFK